MKLVSSQQIIKNGVLCGIVIRSRLKDALTPALSRKRARELIERLVGEVIFVAKNGLMPIS
jgi:hypothetical protein